MNTQGEGNLSVCNTESRRDECSSIAIYGGGIKRKYCCHQPIALAVKPLQVESLTDIESGNTKTSTRKDFYNYYTM